MKYQLKFSREALKDLKKLDRYTQSLLMGWMEKNLEGCENPRIHGKPLIANLSGKWRYRVGDYRILASIQDDEILILIVRIGHRSEIYQ